MINPLIQNTGDHRCGRCNFIKEVGLGELATEDPHQVKDFKGPVDEGDDVGDDKEFSAKFDVLASEHVGKMQMWVGVVKN